MQKLDGSDVLNHKTSLKGDISALKFAFPETCVVKNKSKQKKSVMSVPHGKLQYRPASGYEEKQDDNYDNFSDVTEWYEGGLCV